MANLTQYRLSYFCHTYFVFDAVVDCSHSSRQESSAVARKLHIAVTFGIPSTRYSGIVNTISITVEASRYL